LALPRKSVNVSEHPSDAHVKDVLKHINSLANVREKECCRQLCRN